MDLMNTHCWIALHTFPRMELRVRQELSSLGAGEAYLPLLERSQPTPHSAEESLLFSHYVFLKPACPSAGLAERLRQITGVRALLGSPAYGYRSVSDAEMKIVKTLCSRRLDPKIIPLPAAGARARVRSGPMAGAIGTVLRSDPHYSSLAFQIPIIAGACEVKLLTADVIILEEFPQPATNFRRRGGRRMRRYLQRLDAARNSHSDSHENGFRVAS
jgi:transcription antitermination factor NusG